MDKLQKVRADIERLIGDYNIKTEKYRGMNEQAHQYYGGKRDALSEILKSIDSSQEEPKKCMYSKDDYTDEDRKVLCEDCEEVCKYAKKEPASEDFENALAEEWKGYNDRGAAKVDALEDNTQELAFAKGFYCGWHYMDDEGLKKVVEGVSEDLGKYINELFKQFPEVSFAKLSRIAVRVAKWQKEQFKKDCTDLYNGIATAKGIAVAMAYDKGVADTKVQMMKNIWKPADGDDLPEIDREVIALLNNVKVVFAHRPDPKGWDAKSIITEKVEHYTPETYDKGGWNQPNVKWWLDVDKLPNMEG